MNGNAGTKLLANVLLKHYMIFDVQTEYRIKNEVEFLFNDV